MYLLSDRHLSIKYKLIIACVLIFLTSIILNLLLTKSLVYNIYLSFEKRDLVEVYREIQSAFDVNNYDKMEQAVVNASSKGITIRVLDKDFEYLYIASFLGDEKTAFYRQTQDIELIKLMGENEYIIHLLTNKNEAKYDFHLVGKMQSNYVILSSATSNVQANAAVAMLMIFISASITFGLLVIVLLYFSSNFTKQIKEIEDITEDISNLKFGKKIESIPQDEVGGFLTNINVMSIKLEQSIKDLETTNYRLKKELKNRQEQELLRQKLIANISHEFKTPLTLISGYIQILKDELKDAEDQECLNIIIEETERLSKLVHEFLELSKYESGNVELNIEEISIKDIIEKELKKLKLRIDEYDIKIEKNYETDISVKADNKLMTRVIENLLTNAIKYTKNDKFIKISLIERNNYLICKIFNTADPMKEEDLKQIFQSYYRQKEKRNAEGSGLGLTIVKAIMDLHGGYCEAKNVADGVEFIIKIKF